MHKKEKRKLRKRRKRGSGEMVVDHSTTSLCLRVTTEEGIKAKKMTKMTITSSHSSIVDFLNQRRVHNPEKNLQIQKVPWLIFVRNPKQSEFNVQI